MKLLTVSHFYESHGGGIERVAAQLCRQFERDGHEVVWAASDVDPSPSGAVGAVPLRCTDPLEARVGLPMPIPHLRSIRALSQAIRDCDAVIIHDALYMTSLIAMILARFRGKPVALIQHIGGIAFNSIAMRAMIAAANRLVTRPMLKAAHLRIFISDRVRRELQGHAAEGVSLLLFNGVDTTIFYPRDTAIRKQVQAEYGLPADSRIALFVGRFVAKKGLGVLEALARHRCDLHFVLVGTGAIRPEVWNLPNVHVPGPLPQQKLAELYAASDLLILPSVGEGYPLVIQEAMACGLPIVCGDESVRADPAAAEWLRGVKIELKDPSGSALRCSSAIDRLFCDPPKRGEMAAYAARTYSWPAMARAVAQGLAAVEAIHCTAGGYQPG